MDCMSTGICLLQSGYLNLAQNESALLILEIFLTETLRVGEIGFRQTSVGLSQEVVLLFLREIVFVEHLIVQ